MAVNRFLTPTELGVILDPARWRLVATALPAEIPAHQDPALTAWAAAHVQTHAQQEIVIVLAGTGFFSLAGVVYRCRPGDVFFIDAWEPHGYPYPPNHPDSDHFLIQIVGGSVVFRPFSLRDGHELPQRIPHRVLGGSLAVRLLQSALARLRADRLPSAQLGRNAFHLALAQLAHEIADQGFLPDEGAPAQQQALVDAIRSHIDQTLGRGVTLKSLAAMTGYSRHHLLRVFTAVTGLTVHRYIDEVRASAVKDLLARGRPKPVIASTLGFSSANALARWLKTR